MVNQTRLTYLFDPLCGWCYGASPTLDQIASRSDFKLKLAPTGLFAGEGSRPMDPSFAAFAWSNDQRIKRLTGQEFSEDYRSQILGDHTRLFDSGPATLALTAVALSAPARELEALSAIQRARYIEGRDTTDFKILSDVLNSLGLSEIAVRLHVPDERLLDACRERIKAARNIARQFGSDGVPSLIVGEGGHGRLVKTSALLAGINALLAELRAT